MSFDKILELTEKYKAPEEKMLYFVEMISADTS